MLMVGHLGMGMGWQIPEEVSHCGAELPLC